MNRFVPISPTTADPAVAPLDAALAYATEGWWVLPVASPGPLVCTCGGPCDNPGKHPLTRRGVHDASADPAQIRRWWRRWPGANVGIATGARSGLSVVDVDLHHGATASLDALAAAGHVLPPTLRALTGGGGFHLFYRQPAEVTVPNTVGRLPGIEEPLPGIDLRGDGGYVVAPPSRHVSGRPYRWPDDQPDAMATLPRWLWAPPPPPSPRSVPRRPGVPEVGAYGAAALAREVETIRRLVPGERNDGLNRSASLSASSSPAANWPRTSSPGSSSTPPRAWDWASGRRDAPCAAAWPPVPASREPVRPSGSDDRRHEGGPLPRCPTA